MDETRVVIPETEERALLVLRTEDLTQKMAYSVGKKGVTSIGRKPGNDVVLKDPSVSGYHAKIRFEDDAYFLYDFATTNGTRVNGKKIFRKRIGDGDIIEIGGITFVFLSKRNPHLRQRGSTEPRPKEGKMLQSLCPKDEAE